MQIVSWIRPFASGLLFSLCFAVQAQDTDLCAIDQNPTQFCGKMIAVRATTWHGVDNGGLKNDQCSTALEWRTPERAGVQVRFKLKRDEQWQTFTHYEAMSSDLGGGPEPWLDQKHEDKPIQPPLNYRVTATLHGLFVCRRRQIPWYFLVLESVSDVEAEQDH